MKHVFSVALYSDDSKHWPIVTIKLSVNSKYQESITDELLEEVADEYLDFRLKRLGVDISKHRNPYFHCKFLGVE